jgi:hypothetical protein
MFAGIEQLDSDDAAFAVKIEHHAVRHFLLSATSVFEKRMQSASAAAS